MFINNVHLDRGIYASGKEKRVLTLCKKHKMVAARRASIALQPVILK